MDGKEVGCLSESINMYKCDTHSGVIKVTVV